MLVFTRAGISNPFCPGCLCHCNARGQKYLKVITMSRDNRDSRHIQVMCPPSHDTIECRCYKLLSLDHKDNHKLQRMSDINYV